MVWKLSGFLQLLFHETHVHCPALKELQGYRSPIQFTLEVLWFLHFTFYSWQNDLLVLDPESSVK